MYTEEYERRGFPFRNFILKLILVIVFVLLLVWLLPKFIKPTVNNYSSSSTKTCSSGSGTCDMSGVNALTSQIFAQNLDRMKEAAISYYTDERLPKEVGDSDTMTLSDMIGKKIIIALIDKNNKACDLEKSYVKITKTDDEYILKVNLKDSEKQDYILVHLGCYTYCDSYLCQKQETTTDGIVKGSKVTGYVPIKGSVVNGTYYPPTTTKVVVSPTPVPSNPKCVYMDGRYYDLYGRVVAANEFKKSCNIPDDDHYCVKYDGKYYNNNGAVVSYEAYKKACMPEEEHYCVKYDGKYYNNNGAVVSYEAYKKACMPEEEHYCVKYDGKYYDDNGDVVSYTIYKTACMHEDNHYCVKYDGKYYDNIGKIVTYKEYKKACMPEEKHYCVKYNGKYYDNKGKVVSYKEYKKACVPEEKHYCVKYDGKYYDAEGRVVSYNKYEKSCMPYKPYCVKYNGKYYDDKGKVVSYKEYKKACMPEEKHYCVKYDGKYYDDKGKVVSYEAYKKACMSEEKHYCVKYNGKYYDKNGNVVSEVDYIISCQKPKCKIVNNYYFGKNGNKVSKETYEKECKAKEYIYEYKKTTSTTFSKWTSWSDWNKTNCSTSEINCSDSSSSCLMKLQVLKRKEKIGTYQKTYVKNRNVIRQTGSYTKKACSKYNYVEINKTLYATTTTTTYTQTNTITSTTRHTTGGWTYNGRASYSNPPRDSASTHYKFAGADYSYCSETCTTLPNYYYDSYTYTGGLTSVSSTTTAGNVTSSSSSSTTVAGSTTTAEASCGEYVTKTIPIYGTITIAEKAYRTEPLYGDVCYASTKTRKITSEGSTKTKWSIYNDTSLLNDGWVYTGNKKQK